MKRCFSFLLLIIVLVFCLGLVACGDKNSSVPAESVKYKVEFYNYDDSLLYSTFVSEGESVEYKGVTPTKPDSNTKSYVFSGWNIDLDNIYDNVKATAVYITKDREFNVIFKNWDNSIILETKFSYGQIASFNGNNPQKASDGNYSYTFTGWNNTFGRVTSDLEFIAQFRYDAHRWSALQHNDSQHWKTCLDCGYEIRNQHSWDNGEVSSEPNCISKGKKTYHCSICNSTKEEEYGEALGHSYSIEEITTNPDCIHNGVKTITCDRCGNEQYVSLNKLGHDWDDGVITTQATCTETGVRTYTCNRCDEHREENNVNALGHDWDDGVITTQATCTETGVRTYTCNRCSTTYDESTNALGHAYVDEIVEPTCSTQGYTTHTCSRCSDSYVDSFVNILECRIYFVLGDWETQSDTSSRVIQSLDVSYFFFDVIMDGYEFNGWEYNGTIVFDANGQLVNNVELQPKMYFFADFTKVYTIIWKNYDGEILEVDTYYENDFPTYDGATPTRQGTNQQVYHFSGWNPSVEYVYDHDVTYVAQFSIEEIYTRDGSIIYFGSYPQSHVTNESLISLLNNLAGTLPTSANSYLWTDYGYYINEAVSSYMWYIDIIFEENKYRGVYFSKYRPSLIASPTSTTGYSYQDDNNYILETVYWFKWEPIKWSVLQESDANVLILADLLLDSQDYYWSNTTYKSTHNGGTGYSSNYALSDIRYWLKDCFYNFAFNELQKGIIYTTTVNNGVATADCPSTYSCENTYDKLVLLSYYDINTYFSDYRDRITTGTDYAKCQGLFVDSSSGASEWWTRSPTSFSNWVKYVDCSGNVTSQPVNNTSVGVRPCLIIKK